MADNVNRATEQAITSSEQADLKLNRATLQVITKEPVVFLVNRATEQAIVQEEAQLLLNRADLQVILIPAGARKFSFGMTVGGAGYGGVPETLTEPLPDPPPISTSASRLWFDDHTTFPALVKNGGKYGGIYFAGGLLPLGGDNETAWAPWLKLRPDVPCPRTGKPSLQYIFRSFDVEPSIPGSYPWVAPSAPHVYSFALRYVMRWTPGWTTVGDSQPITNKPAAAYKQNIAGFADYEHLGSRIGWEWTNGYDLQMEWYQSHGNNYQFAHTGSWWTAIDGNRVPIMWRDGEWYDEIFVWKRTSPLTGYMRYYCTKFSDLASTGPVLRRQLNVSIPAGQTITVGGLIYQRIINQCGIPALGNNYNRRINAAHHEMSFFYGYVEAFDIDQYPAPWTDLAAFPAA